MDSTSEAIRHYHELLSTGTLAEDSASELARIADVRRLVVADRPVCFSLRPRFLSPAQYQYIRERTDSILQAIRQVGERANVDAEFRSELRLNDWEEEFFQIEQGYPHSVAVSRLDGFLSADRRIRFVEYNADSPAGPGYADSLAESFVLLPAFREFAKRYHCISPGCQPSLAQSILQSFRAWQGHANLAPKMAIIDRPDVATRPEFDLLQRHFLSLGVDTRVAAPNDLTYSRGVLRLGDWRVNLVYKRILTQELVQSEGVDHPLFQAARDQAVCLVNGLKCRLLARKSVFGILTDERFAGMFTDLQRQRIAEHVPWTRRVEDRKTTFRGETIDLIPRVLAEPFRFVLKPNDSYGGQGVILGWSVSEAEWEQAVIEALQNGWVVQERVPAAVEPFPEYTNGKLQLADRVVETGLFGCSGEWSYGCLTRISPDPVVSVATGGGSAVPTFVIEPR